MNGSKPALHVCYLMDRRSVIALKRLESTPLADTSMRWQRWPKAFDAQELMQGPSQQQLIDTSPYCVESGISQCGGDGPIYR